MIQFIISHIRQKPELVNQDPYGRGWFAKIEVKNFEADKESLLDPDGYFEVLKRKIEIERRKLKK